MDLIDIYLVRKENQNWYPWLQNSHRCRLSRIQNWKRPFPCSLLDLV